jgi:hypothetical protein
MATKILKEISRGKLVFQQSLLKCVLKLFIIQWSLCRFITVSKLCWLKGQYFTVHKIIKYLLQNLINCRNAILHTHV